MSDSEVTVNHAAVLHEQVWVPRQTPRAPPPPSRAPPPPARGSSAAAGGSRATAGETRYTMMVSAPSSSHPYPPHVTRTSTSASSRERHASGPVTPSPCCRLLWRAAGPALRVLGQCMYGLAMLTIIAGIALCIWGYVGTPIRQFQVVGPLCIAIGVLVYVMGCVLCCREFPAFDRTLKRREKEEKIRQAVELLGQSDIIEWIRSDPYLYNDLRNKTSRVLKQSANNGRVKTGEV